MKMVEYILVYAGLLMGFRWVLFADADWRLRDHLNMACMHGAVVLAFSMLDAGNMHVLDFLGHTLKLAPFFLMGHFTATACIQLVSQWRMKRRAAEA
jgi:hypothetical protein